jgi:diaminopimelate epimerase
MVKIPFSKVEGLGNDFVVVDLRPGHPAADWATAVTRPETVRAICDRHFGVGADGVLAILPGEHGDARMRVLNADGSEAEMCGNGIRCVAKVLYESDPALKKPVLRIDTGAGLLDCAVQVENGGVETVTVSMGRPRLARAEIPMQGPAGELAVQAPVSLGGRDFVVTCVSMGNPHAVIFVDDPAADLRALAEAQGRAIEVAPLFPRRTNVEFARVRPGPNGPEIDLVVWERGCGITLACGTGACATAVAGYLEGRAPADREIPVHLPGGTLFIKVDTGGGDAARGPETTANLSPRGVFMRGPARLVFEARLALAEPSQ